MAFPFPKHSSVLRDQLNDFIPGYRDCLEQQGLASSWTDKLVRVAEHIVVWMTIHGTEIAALDIRKIADFRSHDCSCPNKCRFQASRYARSYADRFLTYLMDASLVEMPVSIVQGGQHVDAFICNLSNQGYSDATAGTARLACRHFIVWLYLSDRVHPWHGVMGFPRCQ